MADASNLKKIACDAIDSHSEALRQVNRQIWEKPELCFKESFANEVLTDFLESKGFEVTRKWTLETAFAARSGGSEGPCIGVICEYDALPEVGHACGHNLIAESGVAAALGIKAALAATDNKLGRLLVLGTPAEEGGGGKILMLKNGCFKDVDFCMMVHPTPGDSTMPSVLARESLYVTYKGFAAHAAAFPWEGINALDAAVMAYNNVSAMRQQMKPTWRVHGVILEGGVKPNIIPDKASLNYYIRTHTESDMEILQSQIQQCFEGAAKATGCSVDMEWGELPYSDLATNEVLAKLYQENAQDLGLTFSPRCEQERISVGSTDMGNVSHRVPAIHPFYNINTTVPNHTAAFTAASGSEEAHRMTLLQCKTLAWVSLDVLCKKGLLREAQEDFNRVHNSQQQ